MATYVDAHGRFVHVDRIGISWMPLVKLKNSVWWKPWHVADVGGDKHSRRSVERALDAYARKTGMQRVIPFPALTRCARRQKINGMPGHIFFTHKWIWGANGNPVIVRGVKTTQFICEHCGLRKSRTYDECGNPRAWNYQPRVD